MHERTQIILCRAAFVAACIIPTVATLLWAGSLYLPGYRREQERQLSQLLGLRITLDRVTQPRPGVTVYQGLKAAEPEMGFAVGEVARLEAREEREGLLLVAGSMRVTREGLAPLWHLLGRRLHSVGTGKTRLVVKELAIAPDGTIATEATAQKFHDLDAVVEPTQNGTQAALSCAAAGDEGAERLRFRIARNRQTTRPTTTWELVTGTTPLPCELIASLTPEIAQVGAGARFR